SRMFRWMMPSLSLRRHRQQRHQSLRPRRPGLQKIKQGVRFSAGSMDPTKMVGLGGLEPPTSPLSGARSSHLSYRPQHRGGTLHKYLIVQWFNVFRKCAESSLRYKTATFPIHLLRTIANSRFRPSWNIQPTKRQDVLAKLESAMF